MRGCHIPLICSLKEAGQLKCSSLLVIRFVIVEGWRV